MLVHQSPPKKLRNRNRSKHERAWIRRLQKLPTGVSELVIRRIVKGDPLRHIAQYLHKIEPDLSEETFRKWLAVLAKQVKSELPKGESADEVFKAIEDLYAAAGAEEESSDETSPKTKPGQSVSKRVKLAVTRAIEDLKAERMLRYAWVIQQRRVDKMLDEEGSTGILSPRGHREITALTKIAVALMQHDFGIKLMSQKGGGIPNFRTDAMLSKKEPVADPPAQPSEEECQRLAQEFFDAIRGESAAENDLDAEKDENYGESAAPRSRKTGKPKS